MSAMTRVLTSIRKIIRTQVITEAYRPYTTHYHRSSRLRANCYPQYYHRQREDIHLYPRYKGTKRNTGHGNRPWQNMREQENMREIIRKTSRSRNFRDDSPKKAEKPCPPNHQLLLGCRAKDGKISLRLRHLPPKPMTIEILLL